MSRKRLIGVDFSGARNAGDALWIACGEATDRGFAVEDCRPARELPGGGRERAPALSALVSFLLSEPKAAAGLDFPFSLPLDLIDENSWEEFVRAYAARFGDADAFRAACRAATGGKELKRQTDIEAKVPFCVYNLRLYRQTHAGIAGVLLPLVNSGKARIVPMQAPARGCVTIAEICPASLLKRLDLYFSYKGGKPALRDARKILIETMVNNSLLDDLPAQIEERIVEDKGGDALDAVLAGIGAALLPRQLGATTDPVERIEGLVYF